LLFREESHQKLVGEIASQAGFVILAKKNTDAQIATVVRVSSNNQAKEEKPVKARDLLRQKAFFAGGIGAANGGCSANNLHEKNRSDNQTF
jgi:hypothetical protein